MTTGTNTDISATTLSAFGTDGTGWCDAELEIVTGNSNRGTYNVNVCNTSTGSLSGEPCYVRFKILDNTSGLKLTVRQDGLLYPVETLNSSYTYCTKWSSALGPSDKVYVEIHFTDQGASVLSGKVDITYW